MSRKALLSVERLPQCTGDPRRMPEAERISGSRTSPVRRTFLEQDFSGQLNLMTTAAASPLSAPHPFAIPRGVAVILVGAPVGVSGDWRGELVPYPSLANADDRQLDFFVALGDTIYADVSSPAVPKSQAETLEEYRAKQNEVYSEILGLNTLGDLRASTSILATIDDHEVTNDFAGGALASSDQRFAQFGNALINDTPLFENGLQAFQEYNPIRDEFYGTSDDPRTSAERKLYRFLTYGKDAAVFLLDARSFRDRELTPANPLNPVDVARFLTESFNSGRTMLSGQQLQDLEDDLLRAQEQRITWKFVIVPEPIQNLGPLGAQDRFEGYAAERTRLLKFLTEHEIQNVVFVSADIHGTVVNNLTYQEVPFGPQLSTGAWEISTGAVAINRPFGPAVVDIATAVGMITPAQRAFYDSLPVAGDPDDPTGPTYATFGTQELARLSARTIGQVEEERHHREVEQEHQHAPALDRAAEQQQLLGQRGLAGVGVRDDREGPPPGDLFL